MLLSGLKILLGYPAWFILLCLLAGSGYAALLYYKNRSDGFSKAVVILLASLRFLAVTIMAILLLGPLVERLNRFLEEPLLIVVQDNSESVIQITDQSFQKEPYLQGKNRFLDELANEFDVRLYSFGASFQRAEVIEFDEKITDIAEVFKGIEAAYSNRNIGAVVLASDGVFNRGVNPLNLTHGLPYPVYTVALGDTMPRRDLVVSRVRHNRITYLGNIFPVEVFVEGRQAAGLSSRLSVLKDGAVLEYVDIRFDTDHHQQTVMFELEADEPGMQRYVVELNPVPDEVSTENNVQPFYIEIIDGRQRVLILSGAPHPDLGALKMSLESQDNYEVSSYMIDDFDGSPEAFNLVVLHQLPSEGSNMLSLPERFREAEIPLLYIIGPQTDLNTLNSLSTGLDIVPRSSDFVETLPAFNSNFALFALSDHVINTISALPPLYAPFAQYVPSGSLSVLLYQRIGQVVTEQPLIAFSQSGSLKTGVIAGEGLWRWRLHTFLRTGSHAAFDELISRMVQYLAVQEDKSLFRVRTAQLFYENDPLLFEAELYNRSYELVNDPEVNVSIMNEEGIIFPYVMARTSSAYSLDAGSFPPGDYRYIATVTLGAEPLQAEGRFSVIPLNLESIRTIADHNLLYQIAANTGGELVFADQWERLTRLIRDREDIRPTMYSRRELNELMNVRAVFFILLLLLATEWFVRKRSGSY